MPGLNLEGELDISEALYRAHDIVQRFQMARSNAAGEILAAVRAEKARRQGTREGRKAA